MIWIMNKIKVCYSNTCSSDPDYGYFSKLVTGNILLSRILNAEKVNKSAIQKFGMCYRNCFEVDRWQFAWVLEQLFSLIFKKLVLENGQNWSWELVKQKTVFLISYNDQKCECML